jgi:hypothetical protein
MFTFLKKLRAIVNGWDAYVSGVNARLGGMSNRCAAVEEIIRERTETHVDVHQHSPSQIIMVGRFRGKDFVSVYPVEDQEFEYLIKRLRDQSRFSRIGRVDAYPFVNAVIDRELRH